MKRLLAMSMLVTLLVLSVGCSLFLSTYSVTYMENYSTGGVCPTDSNQYENGDVVSVLPAGTYSLESSVIVDSYKWYLNEKMRTEQESQILIISGSLVDSFIPRREHRIDVIA